MLVLCTMYEYIIMKVSFLFDNMLAHKLDLFSH